MGGLDSKGMMSAFRFHSTSPSISSRLFPSIMKDGVDPFSVEGIDNYPYATPDLKFTYQIHDTGVQVGYWRGVSHNLNAVALECMIDECAVAAGQDPIDYRLAQLDMGSTKHQWAGLSAIVAEVTVSDNYDVSLDKVTAVVDAGQLVHPDQALAQIQSSLIYGQGAGMTAEITVKDGIVEQGNFDTYRVTRQNEAPKKMDIHFVKGDSSFVGGIGEPATAVIVPAIANAVYAASGKRVRTFPC